MAGGSEWESLRAASPAVSSLPRWLNPNVVHAVNGFDLADGDIILEMGWPEAWRPVEQSHPVA